MTIINMAVGKGAGGGATPVQPEGIVNTLDWSLLMGGQIMTPYLKTDNNTYTHRYNIQGNTIGIGYKGAWLFICGGGGNVYGSSYDDLYAHIYVMYKSYNGERVNGVQTPYQTTRRYASSITIYSMNCDGMWEKPDGSELVLKATMSTSWGDYTKYFIIKTTEYSVQDSYTTTGYNVVSESPITEWNMGFKDLSVVVQHAPTLYFPQIS